MDWPQAFSIAAIALAVCGGAWAFAWMVVNMDRSED